MFVRDEIVVGASIARVLYRLQEYLHGDGSAVIASDTANDQDAFHIRAGISLASKQVAVRTLPPVMKGAAGAEIALSWSATGVTQDLYPSLEATISIESIAEATTRIRIVGSYLPPLGDVGVVVDRVVGHRIASATVRSFLVRAERHVLQTAPQSSPGHSAHALPPTADQLDGPQMAPAIAVHSDQPADEARPGRRAQERVGSAGNVQNSGIVASLRPRPSPAENAADCCP